MGEGAVLSLRPFLPSSSGLSRCKDSASAANRKDGAQSCADDLLTPFCARKEIFRYESCRLADSRVITALAHICAICTLCLAVTGLFLYSSDVIKFAAVHIRPSSQAERTKHAFIRVPGAVLVMGDSHDVQATVEQFDRINNRLTNWYRAGWSRICQFAHAGTLVHRGGFEPPRPTRGDRVTGGPFRSGSRTCANLAEGRRIERPSLITTPWFSGPVAGHSAVPSAWRRVRELNPLASFREPLFSRQVPYRPAHSPLNFQRTMEFW